LAGENWQWGLVLALGITSPFPKPAGFGVLNFGVGIR
jgi:hypothetical protein